MKDYSEKEFMHDVYEADRQHEENSIDDNTYKSRIEYFAETYGPRKKLTKQVLKSRNIKG